MRTTDRPGRRPARGLRIAGFLIAGSLVGVWVAHEISGRWQPQECTVTGAGGARVVLLDEQAENAATIGAVAVARRLPTRAAVIATATAMQESKLRNLDHGDRDSLGLFQQRPSQGWGTAAQVRDPHYATGLFYDHLLKVKGWPDLPLTQVAQQVQRSGFPEAYARHEDEAAVLAQAFTGETGQAVTCRLDPAPTDRRGPRAQELASELAQEIGVRPQVFVGDGVQPVRVVIGTDTERGARAVAAWTVAHAQTHGVDAVAHDGRAWRRGRDDAAGQWASDASSGSSARRVVVTVGRTP